MPAKVLPVGAARYLEKWNAEHDIDKMYAAFTNEMIETGKLQSYKKASQTSSFGDGDAYSAYAAFDLKARKLSKLTKGELPEDWFQQKVRAEVLNNPDTVKIVHCFDGAYKGGWRPYPAFVNWCVFCGFSFDDISGNVNVNA